MDETSWTKIISYYPSKDSKKETKNKLKQSVRYIIFEERKQHRQLQLA